MLLVTTTEVTTSTAVTHEEVEVMEHVVNGDRLRDEELEVAECVLNGEGFRDEDVGVVESVINSDMFREELQEMVASLQPSSQPLYDLISLRQRYGQPDVNRKYGTTAWLLVVSI